MTYVAFTVLLIAIAIGLVLAVSYVEPGLTSTDWCGVLGFCNDISKTNQNTPHANDTNELVQRKIVNTSENVMGIVSSAQEYAEPTLIIDYPAEFKINETATIHINYTFQWKNPHTGKYEKQDIPDHYANTHLKIRFPEGMEVVSDEYYILQEYRVAAYPEQFMGYTYVKDLVDASTSGWHNESV